MTMFTKLYDFDETPSEEEIEMVRKHNDAYYNDAVLVTSVGSLPIRSGKIFQAGRKLGKTHQNVLVFVKGDWRKAAAACRGDGI